VRRGLICRMYRYHHSSRTFLLGLDHKDYSQYALEWGMKELFEDNDELVILRVIDSGAPSFSNPTPYSIAEKAQLESEGHGGEKAYQVEAKRLLDSVISQNKDEKAVIPHPSTRKSLISVERHCRISSRAIPRSSAKNGTMRLPPPTDATDRNILSRFPYRRHPRP